MAKYLAVFGSASMIDSIFKWYPRFLQENINDATIVAPEHSQLIDKSDLSANFYSIEIPRKPNVLKDIIALVVLLKLMYKNRFGFVHSFMPKAGFVTALSVCILRVLGAKIIYVHTFTGLVWSGKKGVKAWLLSRFDLLITHVANHVLVESKGVYNEIMLLNKKSNTKIIGCGNIAGVDMSYFKPNASLLVRQKNNTLKLVYVGRISVEKGIFDVLSIFNEKLSFDIFLDIVGSLELNDQDLKKFNKILSENKNINYVGFVSDVRLYIEKADYFIFASWREGFANVILQSLALGVPVISSKVNGIADMLEKIDKSASIGFFFDVKDIATLKANVIDAYECLDTESYVKMKKNSMQLISKHYSSDIAYQGLKDFYNHIGIL